MVDSDIRALVFDVFGTVVDWRTSISRQAAEFGARHGVQADWNQFADYLIGRSALHAGRQSHEMEEVSQTLESIGELPLMARATAERLRRFSELGFKEVFGDTEPDTYAEVLALLAPREQGKN